MDPIRFAIQNPVKVSVGVILIILFGLLSVRAIPIQLTPDVDRVVISVETTWEGASPQEIEYDVIREQEDKLKAIPGLERMTSVSKQGEGQIILEFPVGQDKDAAILEVSEKLRQVPSYPDGVDEPAVEASDPENRDYIAWVILSTTDPSYDVRHLQKWAEDNVKTAIERVPGVSEVNVLGGSEPEVQVRIDPVRMAQLNITPTRLRDAIQQRNINRSAGDVRENKINVRLRAVGKYERLEEIENTVISLPDEPIVRVRDVAEVELTFKEPFASVRSKGQRSLAINAQRDPGTNVMQVMEDFRATVQRINDEILPLKAQQLGIKDLTLVQVYDQTIYIDRAIALVQSNIVFGGALTVVVLMIFLRSVRSTAIIGLAIPVSIIGTFVAMVLMGRNLNVISLAGLAFAVGMVVDNAIVVLENIDRHLAMGKSAAKAAYDATTEVWGAILASTLTTLAVFIPVIFIEEEAGQLFRDISLAICAAVTLSLIVSIMVIPSAGARFLKARKPGDPKPIKPVPGSLQGVRSYFAGLTERFGQLIYHLTGSWVARPLIVLSLASASIVLSFLLMPPTSYLPAGNRNLVFAGLIPPPGYSLEKMEEVGLRVEAVARPYWEAAGDPVKTAALPPIASFDFRTGQVNMIDNPPGLSNFFFVSLRDGQIFCGAISDDDERVKPVAALLNGVVNQQPGIFGFAVQSPLIRTGGASGNTIELEVTGNNYDDIVNAASALFGSIFTHPRFGERSIQPNPGNFNVPTEEVRVAVNVVRAGEMGISSDDLGLFVSILGDGAIIDDYAFEQDNIDLKIISFDQDTSDVMAIADAPIAMPGRPSVQLAGVARLDRTVAPQQINHIERLRSVTLEITVPDDMALDEAQEFLNTQIITPLRESGVIDKSVSTSLEGTAAKLRQVKRAMLGQWTGLNIDSLMSLLTSRAFLSLLVTFLLMAALFESWLYSAVIMFTVPLATVGGFLGLRAVHEWTKAMPNMDEQQLDVLTMLGFVILVGVVVNNAILIVHQALNFMRGQGDEPGTEHVRFEPRQAIARSTRSRIRPIFMTTVTSIVGMLPLVLFPGAGSELYRGLGSVVVGGLFVSTVFTLILTPLIMSLVFDLRKAFGFTRV